MLHRRFFHLSKQIAKDIVYIYEYLITLQDVISLFTMTAISWKLLRYKYFCILIMGYKLQHLARNFHQYTHKCPQPHKRFEYNNVSQF